MAADDEDPLWIQQQKSTFTKWANSYMRMHRSFREIGDIYEDLKDGCRLIALLECLSCTRFPYKFNKAPKLDLQRHENLGSAFKFMAEVAHIPLLNISGDDIFKSNRKLILALFWSLIQFYQLNSIDLDGVSGKDGLMMWVKRQTSGYIERGMTEVGNFHTSWFDGKAFAALLDSKLPNHIKFDELVSQGSRALLERAFKVAEQYLNVPAIMSAKDVMEAPKKRPDDKIVMTYLSLLYNAFASMFKAGNSLKSISVAVEITVRHRDLANTYQGGAAALQKWILATKGTYTDVREGAEGHGATSESIGVKMGEFIAYRKEQKPPKKTEMDALVGTHNTLQQSCKNNSRSLHEASPDPAELEEAWRGLEAQEALYEDSIATSFSRFRRIEKVVSMVGVKLAKSNVFLDTAPPKVFMSSKEGANPNPKNLYGTTASEAEAHLESTKLCSQQLEMASLIPGVCREMLASVEGMAMHSEYSALASACSALEERFPAIKLQGEQRVEKLETTIKEYAKRDTVEDIKSWIEDQVRTLKSRDEGVSANKLSEVEHLELLVERDFGPSSSALGVYKAKLDAVVPTEGEAASVAGLAAYLTDTRALWVTMEASAERHKANLKERRGVLTKLLETKDSYNHKAGGLAAKAKDLELFLRKPVFLVDSEADVARVVEAYKERVLGPSNPNSLTSLVAVFQGEIKELAAVLTAALKSGEEDACGAFERYSLQDIEFKILMDLEGISAEYQAATDALMLAEQEKERLRLEFARKCTQVRAEIAEFAAEKKTKFALEKWAGKETELLEELSASTVKHAKAKDHSIAEKLEPTAKKLEEHSVMNNEHTADSVRTIRLAWETLELSVTVQIVEAEKELRRRQFAAACLETRGQITKEKAVEWVFKNWATRESDLVAELKKKAEFIAKAKEDSLKTRLDPLSKELVEHGVRNNPHTKDTSATLATAWETLEQSTAVALEAAESLVSEVERVEQIKSVYTTNASVLQDRVAEVVAGYQATILSEFKGFGPSAAGVKTKLEEFYSRYKNDLKQDLAFHLASVNAELAAVHESQLKIHHAPWEPEMSKEKLALSFATLESTDAAYEAGMLKRRGQLLELLATKEKYAVVAGEFCFKAEDLRVFLAMHASVRTADSIEQAEKRIVAFEKRQGDLAELKKQHETEIFQLSATLDSALISGEEDAIGSFDRFLLSELKTKLGELEELAKEYDSCVKKSLDEEKEKERSRVEFAASCASIRADLKAVSAVQLKLEDYPGKEAELLVLIKKRSEDYSGRRVTALTTTLEPTALLLQQQGVLDNKHTTDSVTTIRLAFETLEQELALLLEEAEKELLRRQFAAACLDSRTQLSGLVVDWKFKDYSGKEEALVEKLEEHRTSVLSVAKEAAMAVLTPIAKELASHNVIVNAHTKDTVTTVRSGFETLEKETAVLIEAAQGLCAEVARIETLKTAYSEKGAKLRAQLIAIAADFQKQRFNAAGGFGSTSEEVALKLSDFYAKYKNDGKVGLSSTLASVAGDLSAIHEAQLQIFHTPWGATPLVSTEGLQKCFAELEATGAEYERGLRLYALKIQQNGLSLQKMQTRLEQISAWFAELKLTLDSHNYGENLAATSMLMANAELGKKQAAAYDLNLSDMHKDLNSGEHDEHARKPELAELLGKVREEHAVIVSLQPRYFDSLAVAKGEFEMLATLVEPAGWVSSIEFSFSEDPWPRNGEAKPTLEEIRSAKKSFQVSYLDQLATVEVAVAAVHKHTSDKGQHRSSVHLAGDELERLGFAVASLKGVAADREDAINLELKNLTGMFEKSKSYARAATELDQLCAATEEELAIEPASGGLGLAAVEADVAAFDEKVLALTQKLDSKYSECETLATWLLACGYAEAFQAFSRYFFPQLTKRKVAVKAAVEKRETEIKGEGGLLATERHLEKLRLTFASEADKYRKATAEANGKIQAILKRSDSMTTQVLGRRLSESIGALGKPNLKKKLTKIAAVRDEFLKKCTLDKAEAAAAELDVAKVRLNPATKDNVFTLRAAAAAFKDNYKQLENNLLQQIAIDQGRQVAPEKLAEIQDIFKSFDVDNNGALSFHEFHAGLTIVGISMDKEEALDKFDELVEGAGSLNFECFLPFMEECLTAPGSSLEDVIQSFTDLARVSKLPSAEGHIHAEHLASVLTEDAELLKYLEANMTKATSGEAEGQYDFLLFANSLF